MIRLLFADLENYRVTDAQETSAQRASGRLASLDAFRGLTMAFMVVVNNPGSWTEIYAPLRHAAWHGCTPTDLVFPFFLYIVGVSMALSLRRFEGAPWSRDLWFRTLKRSGLLIGMGLLLALIPTFDFANVRVPGVLQRIGLCILLATPIVLCCRGVWLAAVGGGFLLAYGLAIVLIPVANAAGEFGPSTLQPDDNLARVVDLWVFGTNHIYSKSPTDPEGLLSTLPAVVTVLMGVHTGRLLMAMRGGDPQQPPRLAVPVMLIEGVVWTAIGGMLALVMPLNKPLWTPSYVLFTGGLAGITLAGLYWLIDCKGVRKPTRWLEAMGENAILLFVGSGVVGRLMGTFKVGDITLKQWVFERGFLSWLSGERASLAFALANLAVWALVLWVLYKKRWVWRV
jgi:predicted acyltransferase